MRRQIGVATLVLLCYLGVAVGSAMVGAAASRLYYLHQLDQVRAKAVADLAKTRQEAQALADATAESDRLRARAYEAEVARQKPKTITITREIERVVEINREWADSPLPDSVRDALERAAPELGATGDAGAAVPAVPAPPAEEQRRPGEGLP